MLCLLQVFLLVSLRSLLHYTALHYTTLHYTTLQAGKRNLTDQTIGPVLTWTNDAIAAHQAKCMAIPGASLAFGGKPLDPTTHSIPDCYGSYECTAVTVPLDQLLSSQDHFNTATTELFGPFQVGLR